MPEQDNAERRITGQVTFEGGVDSNKITTVASQNYPDGIPPSMICWLNSGTVRGGGILPRFGWKPQVQQAGWSGLYQGQYMYEPDGGLPYLVLSIGGRIYRARVDSDNSVEDLSGVFGLTNPPDQPQSYFVQGEQFLIIQAGDLLTLPLFWDGTTLRRSLGATRVVGFTRAPSFTAPAVGAFIGVPLVAPGYQGTQNQVVSINGANYIQVAPSNFATVKNISEAGVGNTVPAGAILFDSLGVPVTTVLVDFVVPAIGASVNIFVTVEWTGAVPKDVVIDGENWQITATGHAAPAANNIFLVNLTDTPGNAVPVAAKLLSVPELPAATAMDYYMGRIWYAVGRTYAAGDIVKGPSGTIPYEKRDSILKITENPLAVSGDNFVVPTNAGNIRAITHTAELDENTGQGRLYIGTRRTWYRLEVPVTRDAWSDPAFPDKQPRQIVVQRNFGPTSDRSVVAVNGDLWYQSVDGIRSLELSIRNDQAWGNVPASNPERRAIVFNDRALLRYGSGIVFDSRLLMTGVPFAVEGIGTAHRGLIPLDFNRISAFEQKPPAWEGFVEGLDILQLAEGDFGGLQRGFVTSVSRVNGEIEIWEMTLSDIFDNQVNNDGSRIARVIEFPALTWGDNFTLKQLETMELWYDQLRGTVDFELFLRPDNYPCWVPWHAWQVCAAKDCTEDAASDCNPAYPTQLYCAGYEPSVFMPKPPPFCVQVSKRPVDIGYQFQIRLVTRGWNRILGYRLHAIPLMKAPFQNMVTCEAPLPLPQIAPVLSTNFFENESGSIVFDDSGESLDLGNDTP